MPFQFFDFIHFFLFRVNPELLFTVFNAVEGGLGYKKVPLVNYFYHMAIEEGKKQCTNVRAVDISISHYDYEMVPELGEVNLLICVCP